MLDIAEQFEMFWRQYPKKRDKDRAFNAFRAALAGKKASKTRLASAPASLSEILLGLAQYPFSHDPQFIPLPATWLNNRRWVLGENSALTQFVIPASRSSWRDKYDKPVITDLYQTEAAGWKPASARRCVTIQGEIFGDD